MNTFTFFKKAAATSFLLLAVFSMSLEAQEKIATYPVDRDNAASLTRVFKSYSLFEVNTAGLMQKASATKGSVNVEFNFAGFPAIAMSLQENNILGSNYKLIVGTSSGKQTFNKPDLKTYKGKLLNDDNSSVYLTISGKMISGFIKGHGKDYFIEPAKNIDRQMSEEIFVLYEAKDVIPRSGVSCGVTQVMERKSQIENSETINHLATGSCRKVELALAADASMFDRHGSVANVQSHIMSLINMVDGIYLDAQIGSGYIDLEIAGLYISTSAAEDPYTPAYSGAEANAMLAHVGTWGEAGNFGFTYDLCQLWSAQDITYYGDRGIDGLVTGIGVLCGSIKYNVVEDWNTTASYMAALSAHEIGHCLGALHDLNPLAPYIMGNIFVPTTTFSSESRSQMNAYISSPAASCMSPCSAPVANFTVSPTTVCEGGSIFVNDVTPGQEFITQRSWTFQDGNPATSANKSLSVTFTSTGVKNIQLTVTNALGTSTLIKTVEVLSIGELAGSLTISSTEVCTTGSYTLTYSGTGTGFLEFYYPSSNQWTQWKSIGSQPVLVTSGEFLPGYDLYRVRTSNPCVYSNTVRVDYLPSPSPVISGERRLCPGESCVLQVSDAVSTAAPYTNYLWNPGGSTAATFTVSPAITTSYSVTVTGVNGCTNNAIKSVMVFPVVNPVIESSPVQVSCGESTTLSFTGMKNITGCTNTTAPPYPVSPFSFSNCDGVFQMVTHQGIAGEYSVVNVTAGNYYSFKTLRPNGDMLDDLVTISNADGTIILASGTHSTVMKSSYTGQVRFYAHIPNCGAQLALRKKLAACSGNANVFGTFLWSPGGQTTDAITVSPLDKTTYNLVFTDANGCSGSNNIEAGPITRLYVKHNATGTGDGSSWTNAFPKLQDALSTATVNTCITEIWVAKGTYYPDEGVGHVTDNRNESFFLKNGVAVYGGFFGNESLLTDRDFKLFVTTLSGDLLQNDEPGIASKADNALHVVQGLNIDNTAILDGFVITAGNASIAAGTDREGGGLLNQNADPTLKNCVFVANRALTFGGGIFNEQSEPTIVNCVIANNSAGAGGGMLNQSGSSATLINCRFSGNTAGNYGGGVNNSFSSPTMINCTFSGNSAGFGGGGVFNEQSSPSLVNCIIWGNTIGQITNYESPTPSSFPVVSYSIVQGGYPGIGNLDNNPLFVNAGTANLQLQGCSPAINAGLNSANTTSVDLDGNLRVFNAIIDMGAYEFLGSVPPINLVCPSDITINLDPGQCNTVVNFTGNNAATASQCATLTYSPTSGSLFHVGDNIVTVTAIDAVGNSSTCSFTVTVVDNEPPAITPPADLTIECNELTPANLQVMPLFVTSPANISKNYRIAFSSGIAPPSVPIIADLQLVNDGVGTVTDACDGTLAPGSLTGKIALVDRGSCLIALKVKKAQDAGALAVIVINNDPGEVFIHMQIDDPTITIPAIMISNNAGIAFKSALLTGPVTVSFWNKFPTVTSTCGGVYNGPFSDEKIPGNCPNSYQLSRTWTFVDNAGNSATATQTVTVQDKTAPVITCPANGTVIKSSTPGSCQYTVVDNEFNANATDNCATPTLSWTVTGASTLSGSGTMAGVKLNFGSNTITWKADDGCGNSSTYSFIVNVNKITTSPTLVVSTTPSTNSVSQQYSDKITFVATVTTPDCPGAGPVGGTVTFKIINAEGTVVLGSAPVGANGVATLTDTLLENQLYPGANNLSPTNGPLKPGNKTVTAFYSNTSANYIVNNPTAPLIVTCEDADITYNGLSYFGANPNTNQGTITVSAFVLDSNDVNDIPAQARGDIRNATITFKEGSSAGSGIGTANIPVGLVNPNNMQEGIVTAEKSYTLSTQDISCGGKIVDVWAGANNYYRGAIGEVVPVCLSLPGGDYVTGGSWIKMENSEGSYAGTDDKRMHAAIVFKWNRSNKNLQGNATIIYKRVVNGVQKVYQVKSNSITSMIVNTVNDAGTIVTTGATYRMATIVAKANFRDLTDPDFPIAMFGNLTLTITAWESISVTDGSRDRISVQVVGSGSQGLIFSSNWLNGATKWQQLNSGKMRVRNSATGSNFVEPTITKASVEENDVAEVIAVKKAGKINEDLSMVAMPNPSSTNFRIAISGGNIKEPVTVMVTGMLGNVIETKTAMTGQVITIGDTYRSGTYSVRIMQGNKIKQLKLIKLP